MSGWTATVAGTFQQVKWRVRVNYSYEEIMARSVICFRGPEPYSVPFVADPIFSTRLRIVLPPE